MFAYTGSTAVAPEQLREMFSKWSIALFRTLAWADGEWWCAGMRCSGVSCGWAPALYQRHCSSVKAPTMFVRHTVCLLPDSFALCCRPYY